MSRTRKPPSSAAKSPMRFVVTFTLAALVQFGVLLAPWFRPAVDAFSSFAVRSCSLSINALGGHSLSRGAVLASTINSFGVEMKDGCNGLNVIILLWSAVLAFPGSLRWKAIGLAMGAVAIQGLNFVRFISLFYLGQYSYSWFEFAHLYLWETLILLDGLVVFGLWVRYASPPALAAK
jgi:exosortase H (IPTLxxWG-CTERM-specific)